MKNIKLLILLTIAIIMNSCNNSQKKISSSVDDVLLTIPNEKATLYYPMDSFYFVPNNNEIKSDSLLKSMYSDILYNFKEPILFNYKGNGDIIRLVWLRAFENPVIVRVNHINNSISVNIKELEKQLYENDSIFYRMKLDTTFMIEAISNWTKIINKREVDNLFSLSPFDTLKSENYKDATMWVLEYNAGGKYHCIDRLSVNESSLEYYPIAQEMYNIGNMVLSMKTRWKK